MTYNYLKNLNRNIVFVAGFTAIWAGIFFFANGVSAAFIAYIFFSIALFILSYTHWTDKPLFTAVSYVIVSNALLLVADPGLGAPPMTGIGFLYLTNVLYGFAFLIEEMTPAFFLTFFSTSAVFIAVNCTPVTPRLISSIQDMIPGNIRNVIFGITAAAFSIRLLVFGYDAVSEYIENSLTQTESDTFFANLEESICILDRDLKIKRFNRAFIELFQKQHNEPPVEGRTFTELQMDSDRRKIYEVFFKRAFSGEQFSVEFDFTLIQTPSIFEVSFCPMGNKRGTIDRIGVIYRDITARKKLEMDILYSQNGLLEMIAHDLKSPLAMIKNINALSEDKENQYTKFIDKTCTQTIASIDNVLAFSRYLVTSDTSGYINENVGAVLTEKVAELNPNKSNNGQQISLKIIDPDLCVRMNRDAFGRVIGNLISNSIKFTEGGGEISIKVMRDIDDFAVIRVSDQGIGIPAEMRGNLFNRFSKAGRNGLNGEQSYGLGLYISNVIVKLHGGSLALDPTQTVGTTFVMRLPLAEAAESGL